MSNETLRNPLEQEAKVPSPIDGVVEEINEQDLDEKAGGASTSAIKLTLAGKCGLIFTYSYECTNPHVACN